VIRAVLFDLFETLVTESRASIGRASSLAPELGLNDHSYRTEWRSRRRDLVLGRRSFHDVLGDIVRALGGASNDRVLDQLRSDRIREKTDVLRTVDPDVLAAIGALRASGVKLAVVSNCFSEDVAGWDNSPLRTFFNATVFSFATGVAKPDPEIYLAACKKLQVPPDRALFVGDGADDELAGACAAGLSACRAVWFVPKSPTVEIASEYPVLRRPSDVVDAASAHGAMRSSNDR
jgi:putative hydrolase of the HAD superfamily